MRPEIESTLTLAPGKRYRLATEDGSRVLGCDGERVWQWLADVPPGERRDVRAQAAASGRRAARAGLAALAATG